MRLLFDQNISFRITKKLAHVYPDCKHVSDCKLAGSEDSEIWSYAKTFHYTIVTFDADFYDISLMNGHPPKIIWLRQGNLTTPELVALLTVNHDVIERFLIDNQYASMSCLELS